MKKSTIGIIIAVVALGAIAFGVIASNNHSSNSYSSNDNKSMQNTAAPAPIAPNSVTIKDYMFTPAKMTVKVGTTITWTNQDSTKHTVTKDSGDGPDSEFFGMGKTFTYTFNKAGTYTYHCDPHPYMHGSIEVTQ
ncbi:MAG: hypothetical protein NVSMB46_09800 [Candidatus Saccharimonadales bacterium]